MRLLLLTSGVMGNIGGVERFVDSYSRWAREHGDQVTIISRSVAVPKVTTRFGVPVSLGWRGEVFKKPFLNLFGLSLLVILGVPMAVREHRRERFELIFVQDSSFGGLAAVLASAFLRVPVVVYSHGVASESLGIGGSGPGRALRLVFKNFQRALDRWLGRRIAVLIAASEYTGSYFRALIPPDKVKVAQFGLDPAFLERARALRSTRRVNQQDAETKVGFVGRLSREKNLQTLIAAMERIDMPDRRVSLLVAGSGPNEGELKDAARKSSKEIAFLGARSDVDRILTEIDIFALPSLTEGNPVALMEAMAFGKPIVASDIPSIRSMVKNGEEALLVTPLSVEGWAEALRKLAASQDLRRRLGEAAARRVEGFRTGDRFQVLSDILSTCATG